MSKFLWASLHFVEDWRRIFCIRVLSCQHIPCYCPVKRIQRSMQLSSYKKDAIIPKAFPAQPWARHGFCLSVPHLQNGDSWSGKFINTFLLRPSKRIWSFSLMAFHSRLTQYRIACPSCRSKNLTPGRLRVDLLDYYLICVTRW